MSTTLIKNEYIQTLSQYKNAAQINWRAHAATQWAQSELFFRLLLKNTVWALQLVAYANFWRDFLL